MENREFKGTTKHIWEIDERCKTNVKAGQRMICTTGVLNHNEITDLENEANAQLISAAPDILEALQETISCLDRYCIPETSEELKTLYLKSKNAVNKALGIKE